MMENAYIPDNTNNTGHTFCRHSHQRIDEHEDDYERLVRCICLICGKVMWSKYQVKT